MESGKRRGKDKRVTERVWVRGRERGRSSMCQQIYGTNLYNEIIPYLKQKWIARQKDSYHSSTMEGGRGGGVEKHKMLKRMSEEKEC